MSYRFTDNGNSTITDNLTGLMWIKNANNPGPAACGPGTPKTWQEALDYVACLNTNSYLGHNDWRLPNINELRSLVNADEPDSSIWLNTQGFINAQSDGYWSSSTIVFGTGYAWVVKMGNGDVGYYGKAVSGYIWPVRTSAPTVVSGLSGSFSNLTISLPKTGQTKCYDTAGKQIACAVTGQDGEIQAGVAWPNPRFTDNGNSTVTDNLTGLIWARDANAPGPSSCAPGTGKTWQGALDYVACLNTNSYLGHNDWRLPNINELRNLVNADEPDGDIWLNTQGFINVQSFDYWSSTTCADNTNRAWIISMGYMGYGFVYSGNKAGSLYVWPVRGGRAI